MLTIRYGINASAPGQKVRADDADVNGQSNNACPPPNDVTDEVDLFLRVVLSPEADTTEKEWPIDRVAGVRVRCSETSVVLKHQ